MELQNSKRKGTGRSTRGTIPQPSRDTGSPQVPGGSGTRSPSPNLNRMKYKSVAWPPVQDGEDYTDVPVIVVPDQSMSLNEILERFTRDEPLPVSFDVAEGGDENLDNPLNIDLEKLAHADLTEKAEYYDALSELGRKYRDEQKARSQEKAEAEAKAERERIRQELENEQKSQDGTKSA